MARRFETLLRVKNRDNLGDPAFWNVRFDDIDRRISSNEEALENVDAVTERIETVALDRLDNFITPLVVEAVDRIRNVSLIFEATSSSEMSVGYGEQSVIIDAGKRNSFVALDYVILRALDNPEVSVQGRVISFDRDTGLFRFFVEGVNGLGTHTGWRVTISAPPDLAHTIRTDDPHGSKAQAVTEIRADVSEAYNTLEKIEDAIATKASTTALNSAVSTLKGGVAPARDTLQKLSNAIDGFSNDVLNNASLTGAPTATVPSDTSNDSRIPTTSWVWGRLAGKAALNHGHGIGDVSGLQGALDGKSNNGHGHAIGDISGLQGALDGKQPAGSYQPTLGFTPPRQSWTANILHIGWSGSSGSVPHVNLQVDNSYCGFVITTGNFRDFFNLRWAGHQSIASQSDSAGVIMEGASAGYMVYGFRMTGQYGLNYRIWVSILQYYWNGTWFNVS